MAFSYKDLGEKCEINTVHIELGSGRSPKDILPVDHQVVTLAPCQRLLH